LGFVGWLPFALALLTTVIVLFLQIKFLSWRLPDTKTLAQALLLPGFAVLTLFLFFYFMGWIPPVPLSVKEQGIYHHIEKKDGMYFLSSEKKWWKFWQSGDQDFYAEPGDKIYYYSQIYSPARFSDRIFIHWSFLNARGQWENSDRIPMTIAGGRKEGYRGYASKANYQPGRWCVQVETANGLEISRLYFDVYAADSERERNFTVIQK
jgi:hypothetical protein